jgi:hypothetical protein
MEIRNYTSCPNEKIRLLTFSRYTRMSSLLDLIHGKAFIPSFETLSKSDPQELAIPAYSNDFLERDLFNISKFQEAQPWLQQRWENRVGIEFRGVGDLNDRLLMEEWFAELGRRRCTWCWFVSFDCTEESVAMWNLYAKEGVLIKTTWAAIQDSLPSESPYEAALFEVDYVSVGDHDEKFKLPDNLRRPFLFKSKGYKHEQEMRIIFQDQGKWLHPGIQLPVEPKKLIKQLTFSPYLSDVEFKSLRRLLPALPGVVIDHSRRGFEEKLPAYFDAPLNESPADLPGPIKTL